MDLRSQRKHARHRAIVETAAQLFAELGYIDCDMERVAASSGIAKGTIYLYFPGKQELFFACVDWGMSELESRVLEAAAEDVPPLCRIARSMRAYLQFFEDHPQYVELTIQERAIFRDRKRSTYFEHRDTIRTFFRRIYEELIHSGVFRSDLPVECLLDTIGSLLYGTMFITNSVGRTVSLEEQYRALTQTAFGGLLSDQGRLDWHALHLPDSESAPTPDTPHPVAP
ncbi:TetR/AcrR family transcriptional regulator [Planctomicrobium sp. SH661]|uniref:TetR/AcrR family transcriptional regulator n=1 Tax=Planctomicrobium sp. SH661 TaxID=3448124 RepID=UPI003F5B76AB